MNHHAKAIHHTRPGYGVVKRGDRAGEMRYYKPSEGGDSEPISGEEKGQRHEKHKETGRGESRKKNFDSGFSKARN